MRASQRSPPHSRSMIRPRSILPWPCCCTGDPGRGPRASGILRGQASGEEQPRSGWEGAGLWDWLRVRDFLYSSLPLAPVHSPDCGKRCWARSCSKKPHLLGKRLLPLWMLGWGGGGDPQLRSPPPRACSSSGPRKLPARRVKARLPRGASPLPLGGS